MPPPALGYMFVCLERLLEHGSGRRGGESQCIFSNKGCENLLLSWTREEEGEEEERFKSERWMLEPCSGMRTEG